MNPFTIRVAWSAANVYREAYLSGETIGGSWAGQEYGGSVKVIRVEPIVDTTTGRMDEVDVTLQPIEETV